MSDSPLPNDEKLNPLNPQKSGDSPQATPHRRHRSRAGILLPQLRQCLNDLRAMDDREWALRLERIDHDQTPSATSTLTHTSYARPVPCGKYSTMGNGFGLRTPKGYHISPTYSAILITTFLSLNWSSLWSEEN